MDYGRIQRVIDIPEGISIKIQNKTVNVKGKLGELNRDFGNSGISIEKNDDQIVLSSYFPRRKDKAILGSVEAHLKNMIEGTTYGYKYMLKIVYSHFPIRITPEKKKNLVKIENLYGGRSPRYAKTLPGVKIMVDNEDVIVEGIEKEAVGQTAANIQELCRQRGKRRQSPKTFQDGIYVYNKLNQIDKE
ncbi:MAG: 50S ribosomal protein L6 [Candidatus Kariarchaeaceae archaeon]|jgi:large subunit ribosomal protein L6